MTQANINIPDSDGQAYRIAVNSALAALGTDNAGGTAPVTTYANMLWLNTSLTPPVLYRRDTTNTSWNVESTGSAGSTLPKKPFTQLSSASGVLTINLNSGEGLFYLEPTENVTSIVVTYTPTPSIDEAAYFQLVIQQDATARTFTLPASWKSLSGTYSAPAANKAGIIECVSYNGGTTWLMTFVTEE